MVPCKVEKMKVASLAMNVYKKNRFHHRSKLCACLRCEIGKRPAREQTRVLESLTAECGFHTSTDQSRSSDTSVCRALEPPTSRHVQ